MFIVFLEYFNCISFDSIVLVLGIYLEAITKMCVRNLYKAVSYPGGIYNIKYWKQSNCSTIGERLNILAYIHVIAY